MAITTRTLDKIPSDLTKISGKVNPKNKKRGLLVYLVSQVLEFSEGLMAQFFTCVIWLLLRWISNFPCIQQGHKLFGLINGGPHIIYTISWVVALVILKGIVAKAIFLFLIL